METPASSQVLTNIYEIWEMPQERREAAYRIRTEVIIHFFDAEWNNAWGECQGRPAYLPIADCPVPLKPGQRVAFDGVIVPIRERFVWDKTEVRILEEGVDLRAEAASSLSEDPQVLKGRLLIVEGLIDQQSEDRTHITLTFLANRTFAKAYVIKGKEQFAFKAGDYVRMKGVYSPQFDRYGNVSDLSLYVPRISDIEVIGSLKTDPRFAVPLTPAELIRDDSPTNQMLHVCGVVRGHEMGKWVTIWDDTGQVMIESQQTQPLRFGDRIEAIGSPFSVGVQQGLRNGLYRLSVLTNESKAVPIESKLRLAEQVRDLTREQAARRLPVDLRAIVTWSHPQTPFAYVQDNSGGIRIVNPGWATAEASKPGMIVKVHGEAGEGEFVPVVTNAVLSRVGYWNLEGAKQVTLEQALTGVEDGRWVEMRGFVRALTNISGLTRVDLSTSSGEFQMLTPASQSYEYLRGSIVRVQGVCAAISNSRHQLTGIQILSPEAKFIQIEEPTPYDLFAAPMRALDSLRRFNMLNALNQRVRTSGKVVLHEPGRYLYVQDGSDSVFALSQQQERLQPGDWVEVVGFPGNEGQKFLLREAVYRRISTDTEPIPVHLPEMHSVNMNLEGLLAKAEGTLLNAAEKSGEARLLIQNKDSTFEVTLSSIEAESQQKLRSLELGSRLAVTGVYEIQSDEYGKPHTFLLHLRTWNDIEVLRPPPWWTSARLMWVLLSVLCVCLISLVWGLAISRKNKLLHQTQAELQLANDRLELRVQERTQALQEQVEARERAHAELAATQESLMLASRRAGMAEVATGVLHNVGNVLNSVNVSITLLNDRLRRSRIDYVSRVAAMLNQAGEHLDQFLTQDPKGKALPGYLEKLGDTLARDKSDMQNEVTSLAKNIEHIKVIVSMQQSYAKVGGVLEEVDVKDLVEDSIQINAAAFDRHQIELIRDYHSTPPVMMDRHKVLQILINLINNAKYALVERSSGKKVVVSISVAGPERVRVRVRDNGVGIAPENLNLIFSQGFTTRKNGHGFGLHSGAIAARELGGSLFVISEGLGHGASFTLELPASNSHSPRPASVPTEVAVS